MINSSRNYKYQKISQLQFVRTKNGLILLRKNVKFFYDNEEVIQNLKSHHEYLNSAQTKICKYKTNTQMSSAFYLSSLLLLL